MAEIIRIRRGDDWYLGYYSSGGKYAQPQFRPVAKSDARVCLSRSSAEALLGMPGFEGAEIDVEKIDES